MNVDLQRAIDDWEYRERVVELDHPLVTLLKRAGVYDYDDYEWHAASNWNGPSLAAEPGAMRRAAIAPDPTLSFDELRPLLDLGARTRVVLARHPSTPLDHLRALADDEDLDVQLAVSGSGRWADELLSLLAHSRFERVRQTVACRADAPRHVLEQLAGDAERGVADAAAETLARLHRAATGEAKNG